MAFLIDTIDSSGLFAQSANSATIATKDSNGNDITATYQPSGDYYSASNPSGFMTELPSSATDVIDTVTANSGSWGGSALPISAGPGINVNLVNNTLVFSNDETVLWSGNYDTLGDEITASEDFKNFERIGLYFTNYSDIHYCIPYSTSGVFGLTKAAGVANCWLQMVSITQSTDTMAITAGKSINFGQFTNSTMGNLTASTGLPDGFHLTKIVGVNRIAGGN